MQKTIATYFIIFFTLFVYLNRGLFITPYEIKNDGNKEVNSAIEWIIQLITGECNDIDEDGDLQSDCNSVKVASIMFCHEFAQNIDLLNLYSKNIEKNLFINNGNFYLKNFYTKIDHPPQLG